DEARARRPRQRSERARPLHALDPMKRFPIALKLLLLAGFPVLGVLVLASLVVGSAREQLQRGQALGSVESLAELSEDVSTLVYRLQSERARLALELAGLETPEGSDAPQAPPT